MTEEASRRAGRSVTMKDVARLAGVSQPTVSRVLNNTTTPIAVSDATRAKVLEAVAQLGYRPNMTARSLRTQRTQMIALLIADISNGFYHPIARAIQEVARQHDYDVLIANSDHRYENEKHFCEAVIRRPVDGVIAVPIHLDIDDLDRLTTLARTPVVALGQHVEHPDVDVVGVDDRAATCAAVQWLLTERGYETVGYLGVPDAYPPGPRRFQGYLDALSETGQSFDTRFVLEGDFSLESGRRAARALLDQPVWPRVIFAVNDLMAIGFILELRAAGCRVPDDLAIMGFDDIAEATIVSPSLTTIAQDPVDIGRKLAAALFDRITGAVTGPRRLLESSWRIVPRESA
ncbi:MAG: LacI family transcriptional regulator [Chloroflexi bacterium]|nr:LacI family transcriptional regulator [Chloroflexota bacterium]